MIVNWVDWIEVYIYIFDSNGLIERERERESNGV